MHIALNRLRIILLMLLTTNGYAQQALEITHLDQPIIVDGLLEDQWMQSDSVVQLNQLEPSKGVVSTRNTTVRAVQYDQSQPGRIDYRYSNRKKNKHNLRVCR